jgi:hypothetical protein
LIESLYTDQKFLVDVLLRVSKEWCFKCSHQKSFKSCLASLSRKMLVGLVSVLRVIGLYDIGIGLNAIVFQSANRKSANLQRTKAVFLIQIRIGLPHYTVFYLRVFILDYEMQSNSKLSQKAKSRPLI